MNGVCQYMQVVQRTAQMNSESEGKSKKLEKKFLTNDLRCDRVTELLRATPTTKTNEKI